MKNYLVKSLFEVRDPDWKVVNRSHESDLFATYLKMNDISTLTYKNFLQGNWELKFITDKVDNINQAFEKTFWAIHDLWHQEPCNILYTDPDTIAIKPIDIWGRHDHFKMFNYTDPRSFDSPNPYNRSYRYFFNAGVRYFPVTMNEKIWELGRSMAQNWDYTTYDTEQIILNAMLWEQNISLEETLDPTIAWQLFHSDINMAQEWNGCSLNQAKILHLHSSRDANNRLDVMKELTRQLGINQLHHLTGIITLNV